MKRTTKISSIIALSSLIALPAIAYEAGDIIVRAGATTVDPQEDSSNIFFNGGALPIVPNSQLGLDSSTQLGITVSYVLDKNWAVELLLATPFKHTASATGDLVTALGPLDVADTKQLPPTLSAIYYFDSGDSFKPYVGAGINYTIFFQEDTTSEADAAFNSVYGLTGGDIELDDSVGVSFQVGADYQINDNMIVNASVRWIDIDTEATIKFDSGDKVTADIDIDPYVYTLSVGYIF